MPLIEYLCEKCKISKEHIVKHPLPESVPCETCGKDTVRQISMFGGYKWAPGVSTSASVVPKKYRGEK